MRVSTKTHISILSSTAQIAEDYWWDPEYVYSAGDLCIRYDEVTTGSFYYLSSKDNNVGNDPAEDNYYFWVEVGPTNQWGMFSDYFDVATKTEDALLVVFQCQGPVDTIVFTGVTADYINITVRSGVGGAILYSAEVVVVDYTNPSTIQLLSGDETYYNIFYRYFSEAYSNPVIELEFVPVAGVDVSCGKVFVGKSEYIGKTQFNVSGQLEDYSKTDFNEYGILQLEEGTYANIVSGKAHIEDEDTDRIKSLMTATNSSPNFWDFNNDDTDFQVLRLYGFPRAWDIEVGALNKTFLDIEVSSAASKSGETFLYLRISKLTSGVVYNVVPDLSVSKHSGGVIVELKKIFEVSKLSGAAVTDLSNYLKVSKVSGLLVGDQNNPLEISKLAGIGLAISKDQKQVSKFGSVTALETVEKEEASKQAGYVAFLRKQGNYPSALPGHSLSVIFGTLGSSFVGSIPIRFSVISVELAQSSGSFTDPRELVIVGEEGKIFEIETGTDIRVDPYTGLNELQPIYFSAVSVEIAQSSGILPDPRI